MALCNGFGVLQMFGVQAGVTYMEVNGVTAPVQNIVQPWSGAFYQKSLLDRIFWYVPWCNISGAVLKFSR